MRIKIILCVILFELMIAYPVKARPNPGISVILCPIGSACAPFVSPIEIPDSRPLFIEESVQRIEAGKAAPEVVESARLRECIARARAWMVDESRCK